MNHGKCRNVLIMPVLLVLAFMHLFLQPLFSAYHLVKNSPSSGSPLSHESPFSVPFAAPAHSQLSTHEIFSSVPFATPASSPPIAVVQQKKASPHVFQSLISGPPTPLPDNASLKIASLQEKKILADLISKELSSVDLSSLDQAGHTLLHSAIHHNHHLIFHYLVPLYAQANLLNLPSKTGETPFALAVKNHNSEFAKSLFDLGAHTHLSDSSGKAPLQSAYEKNCRPLVSLLSDLEKPLSFVPAQKEGLSFSQEMSLLQAQRKPGSLSLAESVHYEQVEGTSNSISAQDQKHTHDALENSPALIPSPNFSPTSAALASSSLLDHRKQNLPGDKKHHNSDTIASNDTKHTHDAADSVRAFTPPTNFLLAGNAPHDTSINYEKQSIPDDEKHTEEATSQISDDSKHTADALGNVQASLANVDVTAVDNEGCNALHTAAQRGNNALVQRLIPFFAKAGLLNAQDKHGFTPLILAAAQCDSATVKAFIDADADITKTANNGGNALHFATLRSKNTTAQLLIPFFSKAGLLNAQDENGATALIWAAAECDSATVKALIDAGADITKSNNDGLNALRVASLMDKEVIIQLLTNAEVERIEGGHAFKIPNDSKHTADTQASLANIDVYAVDKEGNNALHIATEKGNDALVQRLIPLFARANLLNAQTIKNGCTALIWAAAKCNEETVKALIDAGADIKKTNVAGWNALHHAATWPENVNVMRFLLPFFINANLLNAQTGTGSTALILAALSCNEAAVKVLIDAGADVTKADDNGYTALHWAAWIGKSATIQLLIPLFAKAGLINAENKHGRTPLAIARQKCDISTVQALIKAGASDEEQSLPGNKEQHQGNDSIPNDTKHTADILQNAHVLRPPSNFSLARGAVMPNQPAGNGEELIPNDSKHTTDAQASLANIDVTAVDKEGNNALHIAANNGNDDLVQRLIPSFANANLLNAQNREGNTALTHAAEKCGAATVKALILAGANVKITTNNGYNALHKATRWGKNATVEFLIPFFVKAGLLNAQATNGYTAFIHAAGNCDEEITKALIAAGADVTKASNDEYNALLGAAGGGKNATVRLLIPYFAKAGLLNTQTKEYDFNALNLAAGNCDEATVKTLIDAGASADIIKSNWPYSINALHRAALGGKSTTVQLLIPLFAKAGLINAQANNGNTALTYAASHCDEATVKMLLDAGAAATKNDKQRGYTALHSAASRGADATVQLLIPLFAKAGLINAQTKCGFTALYLAREHCDSTTVQALINAGATEGRSCLIC